MIGTMDWRMMQTRLTVVLTLALSCTAQTITASNWTAGTEASDAVALAVSSGTTMVPLAAILPLTPRAGTEIPPPGLSGPGILANASNQLNLDDSDVALISCDPLAYDGLIDAMDIFGTAEQSNATSVVFYSQTSDYCNLTNNQGSYAWIYSMQSRNDTQNLLSSFDINDHRIWVTIAPPQTMDQVANQTQPNNTSGPPGNDNSSPQQPQGNNPLGASPSTAVAMIILYSITGIITALFLVIIITGAVRAHRHPERYGPRNITGRPRQSRARGLARAMLDSLPIVKFGERDESKPTEVELAQSATSRPETTEPQIEGATPSEDVTAGDAQASADASADQRDGKQRRPSTSEGGIAAAAHQDRVEAPQEHQGCSICTEDFEVGQDQRVLPCDHRFHPVCVDPWLLNVSGTCPLCRIDLRPQTSGTAETQELDEHGHPVPPSESVTAAGDLPPPLMAQADNGTERQRNSIRRSILLGITGSANVGRVERMSREERVLALRQYRGQQAVARRRRTLEPEAGQASASTDAEEESGLRTRLRNVFRVRTRRTGQDGAPQEGAPEHEPTGSGT